MPSTPVWEARTNLRATVRGTRLRRHKIAARFWKARGNSLARRGQAAHKVVKRVRDGRCLQSKGESADRDIRSKPGERRPGLLFSNRFQLTKKQIRLVRCETRHGPRHGGPAEFAG